MNKTQMTRSIVLPLIISIIIIAIGTASAANLEVNPHAIQPEIAEQGGVVKRGEITGTITNKDIVTYKDIEVEIKHRTDGVSFVSHKKPVHLLEELSENKAIFKISDLKSRDTVSWGIGLHITDPTINELRYVVTVSVNETGIFERVYSSSDLPIKVLHSTETPMGNSDDDFLTDSEEKLLGTDIYNLDTDGDGIMDGLDTYITIPTPTPSPYITTPTTASVKLHGEKTEVVVGKDILLRLSAVNLITKPQMTVQVILMPPPGMSVTSAVFVEYGVGGQYTTTYKIEPGEGRDIEVGIKTNQVGDFVVEGRIVYYFGDDISTGEDYTLTLPITVRAMEPASKPTQDAEVPQKPWVPGFEVVFAIAGLLAVAYLVGRKKKSFK